MFYEYEMNMFYEHVEHKILLVSSISVMVHGLLCKLSCKTSRIFKLEAVAHDKIEFKTERTLQTKPRERLPDLAYDFHQTLFLVCIDYTKVTKRLIMANLGYLRPNKKINLKIKLGHLFK